MPEHNPTSRLMLIYQHTASSVLEFNCCSRLIFQGTVIFSGEIHVRKCRQRAERIASAALVNEAPPTQTDERATFRENRQPILPIPRRKALLRSRVVDTKPEIEVELAEVKDAWQKYRSTNGRDAVYWYLEAILGLVMRL